MKMDVHFSSAKDDWETPDDLFNELHERFNFTVDAAASHNNAKLPRYWTKEDDALSKSWSEERVWLNPPYGREIFAFMKKCHDEQRRAPELPPEIICALVPARTDTRWWHEHVIGGYADVKFIKGRLKFKGAKHSAPFPSALLLYGAKWK